MRGESSPTRRREGRRRSVGRDEASWEPGAAIATGSASYRKSSSGSFEPSSPDVCPVAASLMIALVRASRSSSAAPRPADASTCPDDHDRDDGGVGTGKLANDASKAGAVAAVQPARDENSERRGVTLDIRHRGSLVVPGQAESKRILRARRQARAQEGRS